MPAALGAPRGLFPQPPLPRPGPVLGAYPERPLSGLGPLERFADRSVGALRGLAPAHARRWRAIVRAVHHQAPALADLDDTGFAAAVAEVRLRLRREGLRRVPCIRAFALVREAARRTLQQTPYDEQLLGGWAMLRGRLAEMHTGEGKTLAATLPAATAALAGIPVHVITVNDYLVQRDAESMGPVYRALGLRVGAVTAAMDHAARRAAYACDICYCTNKQLVFDYLRDRMARGGVGPMRLRLDGLFGADAVGERLLLRGLCFAIVDEADSVLVDEARTPLVISGRGGTAEDPAQYRQALDLARGLTDGLHYCLRRAEREVELTDAGRAALATAAAELGGHWRHVRQREELTRQAVYALHLLQRDTHYLVTDGKVQIVDAYTGRLMPDRSWERGLHQLVETKEGCALSPRNETLARISYQRFFRRYLHLAGMTGTAREVATELWAVYHLGVAMVPTHRRRRRRLLRPRVYRDGAARWAAVVERIQALHAVGRPVLVGTGTVDASEQLSRHLDAAGIPHRVLNARQDADEAAVIAAAGAPAQVTVATNMAGRGTDIRLAPGVAERGGLHVIATSRHEARRIDRQLYGRCARQGDPGSAEALTARDDALLAQSPWGRLARRLPCGARGCGPLVVWLERRAQRAAEARHARVRRRLLQLDEQVGRLLAFSGKGE